MAKLLIYYPSNRKTVALQSTILAIQRSGIEVIFLSMTKRGELHEFLEQNNIQVFETNYGNSGYWSFLKHAIRLIAFCNKHKITTIHSHLQEANKIIILCQYFIAARVVIFRHHFNYQQDDSVSRNKKEVLGEKLINKLGKEIIVPSLGVYNAIIKYENILIEKLSVIPYLYDFSQYKIPSNDEPYKIFKILIRSRFIKAKRHMVLFKALENLIELGYNGFECCALDDGPEKKSIEKYIQSSTLKDKVVFLGNIPDILPELNSCDILIHPSLYDASNSVVKEAGLLEKTVMVCSGVGDFNEYITHKKNGLLLNPNNTEPEITQYLIAIFEKKLDLKSMGVKLKKVVTERFSVSNKNISKYLDIIS